MVVIGIDPGLDGAVAVIDLRESRRLAVLDTPTLTLENRIARRREYDIRAMAELLAPYARESLVCLESVHAMPHQGVRSMFTMGYGLGVWEGILGALGCRWERVTPQRWKRDMMAGMPREKDASRAVALRLFPELSHQLRRKKDHGRADALLIAAWALRRHGVL